MALRILFLFLATLLTTSRVRFDESNSNPIQLFRRPSAVDDLAAEVKNCLSWRLAVETHNLQGRNLVPKACVGHVSQYMLGGQYIDDCELVADAAIKYALEFNPAGDGKDVWVFDIDETMLSNLPYYNRSDVQFGSLKTNLTVFFDEWVVQAAAPAVPGMLRLYNTVLSLGFKTVILTGSPDSYKDIRTVNLRKAGYDNWEKIIFKGENYNGISTLVFKSDQRTRLVKEGYRIVGNVGDQWGDLSGDNIGSRTFKVPNSMYYV